MKTNKINRATEVAILIDGLDSVYTVLDAVEYARIEEAEFGSDDENLREDASHFIEEFVKGAYGTIETLKEFVALTDLGASFVSDRLRGAVEILKCEDEYEHALEDYRDETHAAFKISTKYNNLIKDFKAGEGALDSTDTNLLNIIYDLILLGREFFKIDLMALLEEVAKLDDLIENIE